MLLTSCSFWHYLGEPFSPVSMPHCFPHKMYFKYKTLNVHCFFISFLFITYWRQRAQFYIESSLNVLFCNFTLLYIFPNKLFSFICRYSSGKAKHGCFLCTESFFFCCEHSQLVWLGLVCQAYFGNGLRINSVLKTIITFLAPEAGSGFLCLASFCTRQRLVLDKQKDGRDKICVFLAIYTHKATDLKWTATCPCL